MQLAVCSSVLCLQHHLFAKMVTVLNAGLLLGFTYVFGASLFRCVLVRYTLMFVHELLHRDIVSRCFPESSSFFSFHTTFNLPARTFRGAQHGPASLPAVLWSLSVVPPLTPQSTSIKMKITRLFTRRVITSLRHYIRLPGISVPGKD